MEKPDEFPEDRLFILKSYEDQFHTGVCADGRQVVMGPLLPYVKAYFFDSRGNLLGSEAHFDDSSARNMRGEIDREWQTELGFAPCPISVKGFFHEEEYIGIQLTPDYLHPEEIAAERDQEERHLLEELRAAWLLEGQFVWCWGDEHWMSADGDVEST